MSATPSSFRAGVVAVIGRPNVGKSSLVNALVGYKVSIVAPKAQTTRHRILGVATDEAGQIVFVDTPGLHDGGGRAINRYLNRAARSSVDDAHTVALVVEAQRWTSADDDALTTAIRSEKPVVLVLNKVDRFADKPALLPLLASHAERHAFSALVPVSATRGSGLADLRRTLLALLPEGDAMYGPDEITDRSERFLVAELIREQVVRQLHEELPYATTVEIEDWKVDGRLLRIMAVIWVERDGQKAIVIGSGGERIKAIGTKAREEIQQQFDTRVHLELHVKVREHWSDDDAALRRFGYGD